MDGYWVLYSKSHSDIPYLSPITNTEIAPRGKLPSPTALLTGVYLRANFKQEQLNFTVAKIALEKKRKESSTGFILKSRTRIKDKDSGYKDVIKIRGFATFVLPLVLFLFAGRSCCQFHAAVVELL